MGSAKCACGNTNSCDGDGNVTVTIWKDGGKRTAAFLLINLFCLSVSSGLETQEYFTNKTFTHLDSSSVRG